MAVGAADTHLAPLVELGRLVEQGVLTDEDFS